MLRLVASRARPSRGAGRLAAARTVVGFGGNPSGDGDGETSLQRPPSQQIRHLGLHRGSDRRGLNDDAPDPTENFRQDVTAGKTADEMMDYDPLKDDWGVGNPAGEYAARQNLIEREEEAQARLDAAEEEDSARRQAVRDELDQRTGRLWSDPWEIAEDEWYKDRGFADAPDWTPEVCSRVSSERLVALDEVPTLEDLAHLAVPGGRIAHPANATDESAASREVGRKRNALIRGHIEEICGKRVERILGMSDWEGKQDAVDELYEEAETQLREKEPIWAAQPKFGKWVERQMEEYLVDVGGEERAKFEAVKSGAGSDEGASASEGGAGEKSGEEDAVGCSDGPKSLPTPEDDEAALPTFVNLLPPSLRPAAWEVDSEDRIVRTTETIVPPSLHPLSLHHREKGGRLVEEWELVAHPGKRHVMLRQGTRDVARMLWEADNRKGRNRSARIMITGRKGCGKTSALAAIVASARTSGNIVLYLPDGDRLSHLGKYIQPSKHRKDDDGGLLFDLPWLAAQVCGQFLQSHADDLDGMTCPEERLSEFFGKDGLRRFSKLAPDYEEGCGEVKIVDLLRAATEKESIASGCYSLAVDHLLHHQDEKPFLVVMDEFNCYFDHCRYFHEDWDAEVRYGIPPQRISLFKPLLDSLGLHRAQTSKGFATRSEAGPKRIKRGSIIVATSETKAVARRFSEKLVEVATEKEGNSSAIMERVDVPAYSKLEVEHALANFEVTGIGRLRWDRGSTVLDEQEVEYLRMVSSSVPQHLMDACII